MSELPESIEWRDPAPMTLESRVIGLAEAIVAMEQCKIDARAFADEVRATLPEGEGHRWPWTK